MGINRKYTGLERTPPSMAWLIEQRRALKGQIDRKRRQIAQAQRALEDLPRELVDLEARLGHLDDVFKLHEVQVQPTQIKGKRAKRKALLPYGVLTKQILKALKGSDAPLLTSVIASVVAASLAEPLGWAQMTYLRRRTADRLRKLVANGTVQRHHECAVGNYDEGAWSLAYDDSDQMQTEPLRRAA